ncbi:MAG TPA: YciI family protein [Candidatus Angelobacter sp.]|nr:YciI family protein [Candidatus Angelobacter sp.]
MQYLLLIYHDEGRWEALSEPERQTLYGGYRQLRQELEKAGKFKAGSQLQPTSTATVVRVRNGKTAVTDGPYAETKEQLAGYFLVEARDLDDAMAIAARIPSAATGSIEVRPLVMQQAQ